MTTIHAGRRARGLRARALGLIKHPKRPKLRSSAAYSLSAAACISLLVGGCSSGGYGWRGPSTSSLMPPGRVYKRPVTANNNYGVPASRRVYSEGRTIPKGGGVHKLGRPYRVGGRLYVPRHDPRYNRKGVASWYGADFHGRKTANGEIYDMNALTAAHPTLPLPSYAYITNTTNDRTILVRVNDRGPFAHNRIVDLSRKSARVLGLERSGTGIVRVRYAGPAPINGDDSRERRYLTAQRWYGANQRTAARSPRKLQERLQTGSIKQSRWWN